MPLDGVQVVLDEEAVGLAPLGRDVADEDAAGGAGDERLANAVDDDVREHARVEAAGPDDDEVGIEDRLDGVRVRLRVVGAEEELLDAGALLTDMVLAVDGLAILRPRA